MKVEEEELVVVVVVVAAVWLRWACLEKSVRKSADFVFSSFVKGAADLFAGLALGDLVEEEDLVDRVVIRFRAILGLVGAPGGGGRGEGE